MAEASLALSQGKSGVIGSEETPAEFGQGLYWVETEDQADGSSILRCTAQVRSAEFVVKTTVLPNLNPVTSRGFFGLEGVELGQGTLIDGYDSTDGSYESQVTEVDPHRTTGLIGRLGTLKQVRFSAGSSSSQASSSSSSSEVAWGELLEQAGGEGEEAAQSSMSSGDSTEAESSVSANLPTTVLADIDGFVVASGTPVLGGDINPEPTGFLPPPTIRPGTAAEALGDVSILGTHTGLPQGESVGIEGDLILRPGATLRLNGPLILAARSLQLMSGAELLLDDTNGPILVFLEQGMDCAEDTRMESLAAEPEARGTSIVVAAPGDTPRPDLSLPSEGRFHGSLYAPGDRVEVPATLRWLGALTARRLTIAPGARLSFDVRLAVGSQAISTTPRITSWRIMPVGDGLARLLALDPRHALRLRGVTPVPSGSAAPESACEALFVSSTGAAETYSGHFSGLDLSSKRLLEIRWEDPRSQELRGWTRWQSLRAAALEAGRGDVVAALEKGHIRAGRAEEAFDQAYSRAWVLHGISSDGALKAFDGADQGRAMDRFADLDEERLGAAREEVRQRVGAKRPQPAVLREKNRGTALGVLQREITKKTRHLAIRRLLAELGELAMELKPCFLMSPMSVAQYLEADHPRFDLVVFDEASQIPVWDGIGAIARGSQAVIVGDPKQLPPTSFFSRSEDEAVEEDEIQDLESILEECIGAQVPTQRLAWHYRSRHESLIAFSNERYYDHGLLTFPSNSSEGLGVSSRYVEGGVYDKGRTRTNAVEAREVVDEVIRRLRDPAQRGRSVGVVTFSQAQQTLVMDLFDGAVREHPELEPFFDEGAEEPVFVKNLENVQGDERDVIVFSVGYGPDERGNVSMNFGPLNKDGGERRLNVAVTRAREEVLVFTSL
ncbi:MAG: DEAD/DEAH box helicase, partial [Planctomycetota bacterium]